MPEEIKISPSKVIIITDATFFGKRKDKMGTLVFKDVIANKIIASKHIQNETVDVYKQLFESIIVITPLSSQIMILLLSCVNLKFENFD